MSYDLEELELCLDDERREYLQELGLTAASGVAMVSACPTAIDRQCAPASPVSVSSASPALAVEEHPKHWVIVRRDIVQNNDHGFASAQIAHASLEAGAEYGRRIPRDCYAGVISVPSEGALRDLSRRLTERGIRHVLIEEPDEPWCGQATAIGIVPTRDHRSVKKLTSSLPRYK